MCMVSINIDVAALRDMRPELDTTAAIRLWAQELVDFRMQQKRAERSDTRPAQELPQQVQPQERVVRQLGADC